jgi:hypothetical protein
VKTNDPTPSQRDHLGKHERTKKLDGHLLAKFCNVVANDAQRPERIKAKARELFAEWVMVQTLPLKEQHAKAKELEALRKRMEKFRKQNQ